MVSTSCRPPSCASPRTCRRSSSCSDASPGRACGSGNHDIVLEHFLEDWGNFILVPFLNVSSGEQRIRIEHGHLYDPFFVGWPNLYEFMTRLVGIVLHAVPSLYSLWSRTDRKLRSRLQAKGTIRGEAPSFAEAAGTILERGFDTVIFGHTHCPGQLDVGGGQTYFNSGSWLMGSSYVQIEAGKVSLLSSPM
jgi:UDP-2,3-diacylglucosamine pyrophosphatase LpxH